MTGIANIALLSEETGRIFGLDAQLLFDILIQGLAVFLLFIFLTYVLINPVRKVLEDRQNKIKDDLSHAATDRAEAEKLRAEYDEKIKNANSEATAMAGKFVASSLDESTQASLIDETLKEMGDDTWRDK